MDVDNEIQELRERWADEDRARQQRQAAALRAKLEQRREALRNGEWKPDCTCSDCLRAVLTLDPDKVCDSGRHRGQWWKL